MLPQPLKAVVFDMDGTVLDTETLYKEIIFAACGVLGYEMTDDVHRGMVGHPRERNALYLREQFGAAFPIDAYLERCRTESSTRFAARIPLKRGVRAILEHLRQVAIPAAIATSTGREDAIDQLGRAGLTELFSAVVTRSDVLHGKPHPETFLRAASLLGVEPASCLAIEDSHNGVRAAHAAGMVTVMVPDILQPTPEIEALCAGVLESLEHVHDLIRSRPTTEHG